MLYNDARQLIKNGDILACTGNELFSKAIKFFTKSKYSHVGIAFWLKTIEGFDYRLFILEAVDGAGVRIYPLSEALNEYGSGNIDLYKLKNLDGNLVLSYALDKIGKDYVTFWQLFLIVSKITKYIRRLWDKDDETKENKYHCSKLVFNSLIHAGYKYDKLSILINPNDIIKFTCFEDPIKLKI